MIIFLINTPCEASHTNGTLQLGQWQGLIGAETEMIRRKLHVVTGQTVHGNHLAANVRHSGRAHKPHAHLELVTQQLDGSFHTRLAIARQSIQHWPTNAHSLHAEK